MISSKRKVTPKMKAIFVLLIVAALAVCHVNAKYAPSRDNRPRPGNNSPISKDVSNEPSRDNRPSPGNNSPISKDVSNEPSRDNPRRPGNNSPISKDVSNGNNSP